MKMTEMDKYLIDKGLFESRKYITEREEYEFTLSRNGFAKSYFWKYPTNAKNLSQAQKEALDNMIKDFNEQYFIDRALTNGINSLYGTMNSGYTYIDTDSIVGYCKADVEATMRLFEERNGVEIEKVTFNDPATIVFWTDGTKTVVKAVNEDFDREKGLAMAVTKKFFGNKGNYYNSVKKWLADE